MQTGGIVKKDEGVSSINSLMRMINNDRAQIKEVSFSSLYGLIFELRIPDIMECETEFFGLNEAKSGFTRPVDAFIIKMSVLSQHDEFSLPSLELKGKVIKKQADVEKNFKKEAILQSKIYYNTLSYGEPICPAIIDLFILKSNAISYFLNEMHSKCDNNSKTAITWLKKRFESRGLSLGLIAMESALSYKTFYNEKKHLRTFLPKSGASRNRSIARSQSITTDELGNRYENLIFTLLKCVVRLYNECRIEHLDLHEGNSMVKYNDDDKTYSVYLIDFGRTQSNSVTANYIARFMGYNKNGGFMSSFTPHNVSDIISKIILREEQWRKNNFNTEISLVYENYVRAMNERSLYANLADALNLFYSKGLFKYKQLSESKSYDVNNLSHTHSKCNEGKWTRQYSPTRGDRWKNESGLSIPLSGAAPVVGGKSRKTRRKKSIRNKSVKRR